MLALAGRTTAARRACPRCGAAMASVGFAMLPGLREGTLTAPELEKPLTALGLATGDVVLARARSAEHAFELVAP